MYGKLDCRLVAQQLEGGFAAISCNCSFALALEERLRRRSHPEPERPHRKAQRGSSKVELDRLPFQILPQKDYPTQFLLDRI
jgi:hypothetical protein